MSGYSDLQFKYGPKAAQLIEMKHIVGVTIPPVFALSHDDILELFSKCGLNIKAEWDLIASSATSNTEILHATGDRAPLAILQTAILNVAKEPEFHRLLTELKFNGENLGDYLLRSPAFMIRSSGSEDSAGSANAGGHESHPSNQSIEDVAEQLGKVLASYFKHHGLAQRASSGEDIRTLPRCSLFAQSLIKEENPDPSLSTNRFCDMVVSGVAYTQGKHPLESSGVLINSAFGHGQGVVESEVPTDRYFVYETLGRSPLVERSINQKTHRIAGKSLDRTLNPADLHFQPTLTESQALELSRTCREIESANDGVEMDIEWVFKDNTFYIVQARPKPETNRDLTPSYVDSPDPELILEECQSLVPGFKAIEDISLDTMICDPKIRTLDQARKAFLKLPPESIEEFGQDLIEAIFVEEPAAETSHEAGFFRARGIPCFQVNSVARIKDYADEEYLTIDPQNNRILQGNHHRIKTGLSRDPAAHPISFKALPEGTLKTEIAKSMPQMGSVTPDTDLRTLFASLRTKPNHEDLATVLKKIGRLCLKVNSSDAKALWENAVLLSSHLRDSISEDEVSIEQLSLIRQLEALVFQTGSSFIANSFSLVQLLNEQKINLSIVHDKIAEEKAYLALMRLAPIIVIPSRQENYARLVRALSAIADNPLLRELIAIISTTEKHHILDEFLNCGFKTLSVKGTETDLLMAFEEELKDFKGVLETPLLQEAREQSTYWKAKISHWQDPAKFGELQKHLCETLMPMALELIGNIYSETQAGFTKQLYLKELQELIDVFDQSLKSITGRTIEIGDTDALHRCIEQFSELLQHYRVLSDTLLEKDILDVPGVYGSIYDVDTLSAFESYKTKLASALKYGLIACMALSDFDAMRQTLSPTMETARLMFTGIDHNHSLTSVVSITLEDDFTRLHQHMNYVTSRLNLALRLPAKHQAHAFDVYSAQLPSGFTPLLDALFNIDVHFHGDKPIQPRLMNIEFRYPKIEVNITLPLRQHNASIDLSYDRKNKHVESAHFKFVMGGEKGRTRALLNRYKLFALEHNIIFQAEPFNNHFNSFGYYSTTDIKFVIPEGIAIDPTAIQKLLEDGLIETTYQSMGITPLTISTVPTELNFTEFFHHGLDGATEIQRYLLLSEPDNYERRLELYEAIFRRYRQAVIEGDKYNTAFLTEKPNEHLSKNHDLFRQIVIDCYQLRHNKFVSKKDIKTLFKILFNRRNKSLSEDENARVNHMISKLFRDSILPEPLQHWLYKHGVSTEIRPRKQTKEGNILDLIEEFEQEYDLSKKSQLITEALRKTDADMKLNALDFDSVGSFFQQAFYNEDNPAYGALFNFFKSPDLYRFLKALCDRTTCDHSQAKMVITLLNDSENYDYLLTNLFNKILSEHLYVEVPSIFVLKTIYRVSPLLITTQLLSKDISDLIRIATHFVEDLSIRLPAIVVEVLDVLTFKLEASSASVSPEQLKQLETLLNPTDSFGYRAALDPCKVPRFGTVSERLMKTIVRFGGASSASCSSPDSLASELRSSTPPPSTATLSWNAETPPINADDFVTIDL